MTFGSSFILPIFISSFIILIKQDEKEFFFNSSFSTIDGKRPSERPLKISFPLSDNLSNNIGNNVFKFLLNEYKLSLFIILYIFII